MLIKVEIKTKYKLGDDVYFIKDNKIHKDEIIEIKHICTFFYESHETFNEETECDIFYVLRRIKKEFKESELFETKEEIFESLFKDY